MADYSEALQRYGPDSSDVARIRRRYDHLEGFAEFADSSDTIHRSLEGVGIEVDPILKSAEAVEPCRLIVRAGTDPVSRRRLRWKIGVVLLRAGVLLLGWKASFRQYELRIRGTRSNPLGSR